MTNIEAICRAVYALNGHKESIKVNIMLDTLYNQIYIDTKDFNKVVLGAGLYLYDINDIKRYIPNVEHLILNYLEDILLNK